MASTKPRTAPKRKSTVRVAKKKRGISRLQALVLASVLALVGVVVVVVTQASGTPNYQYSWSKYCTSDRGTTSASEVQECKNTSAEAMVYRLYRGLFDKSPDDGGYKFWTQKLAGDRIKVTELSLVRAQVAKMGSDTAFVKSLYTDMMDRTPTTKEVDQWVGRLKASGSKRWSREKIVYHFAISGEAISKNQARWNSFVASAPRVEVVQTAAADQRKRFDAMLTDYASPAKKNMESVDSFAKQAQNQLTAATAIASKGNPSAGDLQDIAKQQAAARSYLSKATEQANSAQARLTAAERLYRRARAVALFSTDIGGNSLYGISKINARNEQTKVYAVAATNKAKSITKVVDSIADKYKIAEKKYEAALIAAEQAAKKNAGTPTGGACSASECPPPEKVPGETVAQADKRWSDTCNSLPDKRRSLTGNGTFIANGKSVDAMYDVYYVNDGKHRRSCDLKFKNHVSGTLVCNTGWTPSGMSCVRPTQATTTKVCPTGWFPDKGYCWNENAQYAMLDEGCPRFTFYYGSKTLGGVKYYECRARVPQGRY